MQKDLKNKKNLLALNHQQTITKLTRERLADVYMAHRGIQLLPSNLLASGWSAKPLVLHCTNGLTVCKHPLYKKKKCEKVVPKHFNGFEPLTSRERTRVDLNRCAPNCVTRWNRYTISELSAKLINSNYSLVLTKYYKITSEFNFGKIQNLRTAAAGRRCGIRLLKTFIILIACRL